MPRIIETYATPESLLPLAVSPAPFGPGFAEQDAKRATKLEVVGSSLTDPGPDWCEFRLYRNDQLLATRQVAGY